MTTNVPLFLEKIYNNVFFYFYVMNIVFISFQI